LKKLSRGVLVASLLSWLLAAACSLVVDPDPLQQGCAPGTKPCEVTPGKLSCVSQIDPKFGCARDSCVPCALLHAVEVCGADGSCAVGTCEKDGNYDNCDRIARTGCEVDRDTSYDNCGGCDNSCDAALRTMPGALSSRCSEGRCVVKDCSEGYADCDGAASNGCEKPLPEEACGRCLGCPETTECNLETRRCE